MNFDKCFILMANFHIDKPELKRPLSSNQEVESDLFKKMKSVSRTK